MTHEVLNQPPPLEPRDLYRSDRTLVLSLHREGAGWAESRVASLGALAGDAGMRWGAQANEHSPVLRTHDRFGHRIDEVDFHPAYHDLMRVSIAHGVHALPWQEAREGAHVARAALFYVIAQAEAGHVCPMSMTNAAFPVLRHEPSVAAEWEPRLLSSDYDPRALPVEQKAGATFGMWLTEKQGGSDVRANTTRAEPIAGRGSGAEYVLTGHKWFCSGAMGDGFLALAQTGRGLSCFVLPRWRPDGTRNAFRMLRLKDKVGNRSNATAEVELDGAWARMIGDEGRGVATILEMVQHTRLDCIIGSSALMRQALAQAIHHTTHRAAFGKHLGDQPLMKLVLADLAIESEAALLTTMRVARSFDGAASLEGERLFGRLATPISKYWVCKRTPGHVYEALECLGGGGYVEESILPRLYREAPVNSVWEGSGNVICLDVLRVMVREPDAFAAFFAELELARGGDRRLDDHVDSLRRELRNVEAMEARARRVVERMALALQGSLLVRHSDPAVADAFCASRLAADGGFAYGTLPVGTDCARILERARPS